MYPVGFSSHDYDNKDSTSFLITRLFYDHVVLVTLDQGMSLNCVQTKPGHDVKLHPDQGMSNNCVSTRECRLSLFLDQNSDYPVLYI